MAYSCIVVKQTAVDEEILKELRKGSYNYFTVSTSWLLYIISQHSHPATVSKLHSKVQDLVLLKVQC